MYKGGETDRVSMGVDCEEDLVKVENWIKVQEQEGLEPQQGRRS